jgi:hypothetical protein
MQHDQNDTSATTLPTGLGGGDSDLSWATLWNDGWFDTSSPTQILPDAEWDALYSVVNTITTESMVQCAKLSCMDSLYLSFDALDTTTNAEVTPNLALTANYVDRWPYTLYHLPRSMNTVMSASPLEPIQPNCDIYNTATTAGSDAD